ncbi:unnamed protein product [Rotaria sp. Silwood2]|nr:unnamed protein product [Rotaria sp. Silwood2]
MKGIPRLKDCLDNGSLYFGPASSLVDFQVECAIVFKDPRGQLYYGPFEFVLEVGNDFKFKNPTVFHLTKDLIDDNGYFPLNIIICKIKNDIFESSDKQGRKICRIKKFPCGTMVEVNHQFLSSLGINMNKKNRNTEIITPTKLAKYLNVYTGYLIVRRKHWDPDKNSFVLESGNLFCSNGFRPVDSKTPVSQFDYSPNKLQITQVILSTSPSLANINQFYLQIPPSYQCTQLKNKCLEAKLFTGNEEESNIHSSYKFICEQQQVDSIFIDVGQYDITFCFSSFTAIITKVTNDAHGIDSTSNGTQSALLSSHNSTFTYEENISSSSPLNDNLIVDCMSQSSVQSKRSFEKEHHERTSSPSAKNQKYA